MIWFYNAGIYNGLPLDDRSAIEQVTADRPHGAPNRDHYVYYPDCASVPEQSGVVIGGRSYTIAGSVAVESVDAAGVIYAHGGVAGGHTLYVKDRRLHYVFNWVGTHLQVIDADRDITPGAHIFTAEFTARGRNPDSAMPGAIGDLTLYIDQEKVGRGEIVHPTGLLLRGRGRHHRRPGRRLADHPRLPRPVPVHRWHHRQGRRGCLR